MTVIVLTAVPASLRGVLTRWLFEIAPGVFVGRVSARVRELLWERIVDGIGRGRAILVHSARNEQRLAFMVHGHDWTPEDFDGLALMLRPADARSGSSKAGGGPRSRPEDDRGLGEGPGGATAAEPVRVEGGVSPPRNWSHAARRLRGL